MRYHTTGHDEGAARSASVAAQELVHGFVMEHRAAAIPALIAACVLWAVEHGGTDVVKGSLHNAINIADELADIVKGMQQ